MAATMSWCIWTTRGRNVHSYHKTCWCISPALFGAIKIWRKKMNVGHSDSDGARAQPARCDRLAHILGIIGCASYAARTTHVWTWTLFAERIHPLSIADRTMNFNWCVWQCIRIRCVCALLDNQNGWIRYVCLLAAHHERMQVQLKIYFCMT